MEPYPDIVGHDGMDALREVARPLHGARIAHVNATAYGGGVSELLRSVVPLYRALEIDADWLVIPGQEDFFEITKGVHNALQGADFDWTEDAKASYLAHNETVAALLTEKYDFVVVHDPQPAPLRHFRGRDGALWIWRCHIDTSE
ncbi:MAG: glycosyl transferase family 1, partial [Gemmatimonadota bacterium]